MRSNSNAKAKGGAPRQNSKKTAQRQLDGAPQRSLSLVKSYPRQVVWDVWLPLNPIKLTTTVTTGLIANAIPIIQTAIASFAARFGATFVEYRMVQAKMEIRMFSSNNPGVLQFWFDEKSAANPSLVEAAERYVLSINSSDIVSKKSLMWTARDVTDLAYTAIGTAVTPVTFKTYTNNANFGSSIVATDYCEIEGAIRFQFRGLQGV
jgi:hypothetical protein